MNNNTSQQSRIKFLKSKSGRTYVGIDINPASLELIISTLKSIQPDNFDELLNNQSNRDDGEFHLTVVSPEEYINLTKFKAGLLQKNYIGKAESFCILGLGKNSTSDNIAFYAVVESEGLDALRNKLLLPKRDFHITIGFSSRDIHGVKKDRTTLVAGGSAKACD